MSDFVFFNTLKVLEDYAVEAKEFIKHELVNEDKVASGALLRSIETTVEGDGGLNYKVVLHAEDYLRYIEQGRQPNGKFPPPQAIRQWIDIKPVIPRPLKNGKLPTPEQLTFLISRKIATEGIKPTPIIARTKEELNSKYEALLEEALRSDIEGYINKSIEEIKPIIE